MLKSGCFKVQVQLIAEKGSVVLPSSTDRELGLTDQKLQVLFFLQNFKQAQACEMLRVSSKLKYLCRETLAMF